MGLLSVRKGGNSEDWVWDQDLKEKEGTAFQARNQQVQIKGKSDSALQNPQEGQRC